MQSLNWSNHSFWACWCQTKKPATLIHHHRYHLLHHMAMTTLSFSLPLDSPQPLFLKSNNTTYLNNSINSSSRSSNSRPLSVSFTPSSSYHPLYSIIPSSSSHSSSSGTHLNNPLTGGRFLDEKDLEKIETLKNFMYTRKINGGSLKVRVMEDEEIDVIVRLLAESFAESMSVPWRFVTFLGFLVKQYVRERRVLLPHAATLVGLYEGEDGKAELAGTVEISFDKQGANASPPTPIPPMECPYICNMAVKKQLRRYPTSFHWLGSCYFSSKRSVLLKYWLFLLLLLTSDVFWCFGLYGI